MPTDKTTKVMACTRCGSELGKAATQWACHDGIHNFESMTYLELQELREVLAQTTPNPNARVTPHMVDAHGARVEVEISTDGRDLIVNIEGVCALRAKACTVLLVADYRPRPHLDNSGQPQVAAQCDHCRTCNIIPTTKLNSLCTTCGAGHMR